jgi:hypothetical protein
MNNNEPEPPTPVSLGNGVVALLVQTKLALLRGYPEIVERMDKLEDRPGDDIKLKDAFVQIAMRLAKGAANPGQLRLIADQEIGRMRGQTALGTQAQVFAFAK